MGAVASFVEDVVGGVVEAVGDVVDTVVDVVKDVGKAIDDYVIQPILDDPLSAIATVAAATFLGPAAAAYFGTSAAVGVGIAAGAANTAAGLVQGEDFDEAVKGGLMAGVGAGVSSSLFGGTGGEASPQTNALDDFLAANNNFADVQVDPTGAVTSPVPSPSVTPGTDLAPASVTPEVTTSATPSPLESATAPVTPEVVAPSTTPTAATSATPSPLQSLNTTIPQVEMPSFNADYSLSSGMKPDFGLQVPKFTPDTAAFDIYGDPTYSLTPQGVSGGPGLQLPSAPNLARMGGGQGITADMYGLPQYMENGVPTTFQGANGQTYGNPTPDVTVSQTAITPTPQTITYDATTNMGTPTFLDQVASGDLMGAAKTAGTTAVDWAKENPWTAAGVGLTALQTLGGAGGPKNQAPPPKGSTQDKNFTKSLDLYNYMRDKTNYQGDLTKYGQTGQQNAGEHQYFQNTQFVPVPIPAKMGGLIQMKHFAQGGMARGMQDPRRAQMMASMAQQRPAGQGGPMGMAQGRPPMMQGGAMPQRPMSPQNAQGGPQGAPQGMQQGRPQMPQRPRDPKTAYYQYGNAPVQAKAAGGLSQVHSMKIGGGADGRSDDVNAVLSDGEYVMDAETVAMLGNGSSKAGAQQLDQMRSNLRKQKGQALSRGQISPDAKSPLSYLRGA